jgi:hypothetical protein
MIVPKWIRHLFCYFAVIGMLVPSGPSWAAEPNVRGERLLLRRTGALDVSLTGDGLLQGRVVDRHGRGSADTVVRVLREGQVISEVKSDATGSFRVVGLTTGVYHLVNHHRARVCRVWRSEVAPPSAHKSVQLIADGPITAGQVTPLKWWLADPLVIAGITAIAIAVPVAVHNARNDRDSGS